MIRLNKPGREKGPVFLNDFIQYIDDIENKILPLDLHSLLLTIIELSTAIDELLSYNLYDNKIMESLISISWCWHQDIRYRYNKLDDELYTYCYILSWVNLSRLTGLKIYDKPKLNNQSNEFTFIQKISSNEMIVISNNIIKDYSILVLWQSIVLLWPCLYKYPYSDEMRIYFNTLYSRFCYLLTYIIKDDSFPKYYRRKQQDDEDQDEEHEKTLIDYYSDKFDYRSVSLKTGDDHVFKSCFFFDTELIFFHQLSRISLMKKLSSLHQLHKLTYSYTDIKDITHQTWCDRIIKMILCFKESIIGFIENEFLKNDIWEDLKSNLSRLYLMHGENERYFRDNYMKSNQSHADEILNKIRPNDYQKINTLKEKIPKDFINEYTECFTKFIESTRLSDNLFDSYHLSDFKSEKESIYLTYLCFEKWVSLSKIKINLKEIFYYDIITDINKIDDVFDIFDEGSSKIPIFITVMKHSFILDIKNKKVFHSLLFIEAFTIWIILLMKENIITNKNNNENTGLNKFKNFEKFIKFLTE
jgi:hypothetical protein